MVQLTLGVLIFQILAIWNLFLVGVCGKIVVNTSKLELIEYSSKILCSFQTKTIYVYFENETSLGYPGQILQELCNCDTSYISMRNKFKTAALEVIKDDGILMYLVMIQLDAWQSIELSIIKKKSASKHISHVLLLVKDSSSITMEWLRHSFQQFWRLWVLNVVIIFWRKDELHVYRYNPFMDNFLIKVNYTGTLPKLDELFPKKIPNMQNKPLRMCMYADEIRAIFGKNNRIIGCDGLMSSYIAERLNATAIIDRIRVYAHGNRSSDICFREVAHELDDVALNIRFLSLPTFYKRVEHTIVYNRDDLCVLVPKADTASTFWNLFRSFHTEVWLSIMLSVPLAYGFCVILHQSLHFTERLLLQLFASTLSLPFTHVPQKFSLRLFLFSWLFYGMLICGAFKGNLTTNLVFRRYLPDINTMRDLALAPYPLLMFPRHKKHLHRFLNDSDRYEAMVKRKMVVIPDNVLADQVLANNISNAYLEKEHVAVFHANARRHMRYGRPVYHVMSTCPVPYHAVYIVPYGSPYLGFINTLVRSSHEFGFYSHWERIMHTAFKNSGKSVVRSQMNGDDPVVLKLGHLQAAFCLLVLGLIAALLVFLGEVFSKKKTKQQICGIKLPYNLRYLQLKD